MSDRDPRWNPKDGDVVQLGRVVRGVTYADGLFVEWGWPDFPSASRFTALIEEWRIDNKDAEVIHVAD